MNSDICENLKLEALELARKSMCNFQHGCLIVRQGRVVASGFNDEFNHAEHNAVEALQRLLWGSRERKDD